MCDNKVHALQYQLGIAGQRTATGRFSGHTSQAAHVLLQLLSVLCQALATLAGKLHEPPPQAAPSQKGCGSCPALRTITVTLPRWYVFVRSRKHPCAYVVLAMISSLLLLGNFNPAGFHLVWVLLRVFRPSFSRPLNTACFSFAFIPSCPQRAACLCV